MANYGSNPFGDPEGSNPYGDGGQSSFSASNTGATGQNFTSTHGGGMYKPPVPTYPADANSPFGFYDDPARRTGAYGSMASPSGQMDSSNRDNVRQDTEEFRRRQEDLERKAAELERRESQLRNPSTNVKTNNWPAFSCGPLGPCFFQDFDVDIGIEYKSTVKTMYFLWIIYSALLFINMIASIAYLAIYGGTGTATTFGLAVLWVVLFIPISFLFWYRPLYKAFRSDSSLNFFIFFIIFTVQCGVTIVQSLGVDSCGTLGFINGLTSISKREAKFIGVGALMVVVGVLFALLALADIVMLIKIHRIYRTTGASFKKAQQEFAVTSLTNPHVQSVAVDVATRAAQDAYQREGGQF